MKFTEKPKIVSLLFSGERADLCHDKRGLKSEGGKDGD
jgi:hypothetical protein